MKYKLFLTEDGSHSVVIHGTDLTYHSRHGAIQESKHIFVRAGLLPMLEKSPISLNVFDMGFGTGLNALLTLAESASYSTDIFYHAIDVEFLPGSITGKLNYCKGFNLEKWGPFFDLMHSTDFGRRIRLTPKFCFLKSQMDIRSPDKIEKTDLVYFDAFAPDDQPELWTFNIFQMIYNWLSPNGHLVTYSAKGEVRRALVQAGFTVKKMPGPPGKREFIVAKK